jgi:hypothetical protein
MQPPARWRFPSSPTQRRIPVTHRENGERASERARGRSSERACRRGRDTRSRSEHPDCSASSFLTCYLHGPPALSCNKARHGQKPTFSFSGRLPLQLLSPTPSALPPRSRNDATWPTPACPTCTGRDVALGVGSIPPPRTHATESISAIAAGQRCTCAHIV